MKQKIEWYREVLEIEPNSKIFFPLSRMLAKDERSDEAIAVLRQGVGRHPDHVEARLFLVELLYAAGRSFELQQEVDVLSVMFKEYPGFWRAWGERLFDDANTRDAGLAAIFMAAFLQNLPVSWAGVIEHGLKSLVGGASGRASVTENEAHPLTMSAAPDQPAPVVVPDAEPSLPQTNMDGVAEAAAQLAADPEDAGDDEDVDEPITLRTRSMAEVLAEQGDVAGALDIYNELVSVASREEKPELEARIAVLSGKAAPEALESETEKQTQEDKKDWLAILAQRLEARSLQ